MTTRHLVSDGYLSLLCDIYAHRLVYAGLKLITLIPCKSFNSYYRSVCSVRKLKRRIPYLTRLLTENRAKKPLLCRKLCLSLRGYLTHKDVSGAHLGAYAHDAFLVKILKNLVGNIRDISCYLLGSELRVTGLGSILFYMYGCINIILNKTLAKKHGILVVIALPGHKSDKRVLSESYLSVACGGSVCDNIALLNLISLKHERSLIIAVTLVTSHKL